MVASTEVLAPTAGLVVKVNVAEGSSVASGDTVVVLQSMKTEILIQSDVAGKVSKVQVKQGDEVNIGQTLVEIES